MWKLGTSRNQLKIAGLLSVISTLCALAWALPPAVANAPATPQANHLKANMYNNWPLKVNIVQKNKLHWGNGQAPNLGDELILTADLSFRGSTVGRLDGTITTTRVESSSGSQVIESSQGLFTITLALGQLTLQFFQRDDHQDAIQFAVTGGTGAFQHTGGDGTLVKTGENTGVIQLDLVSISPSRR
jgi:hypothetical protein